MNRLRVYRWGILVLLLLNLATLLIVVFKDTNLKEPNDLGGPLEQYQSLGLSEEVFQSIKASGSEHRRMMKELNRKGQRLITESLLSDNAIELQVQEIADLEFQKLQATRAHFNEIEELLTEDQKIRFQAIKVQLVRSLFRNSRPPMPPPNRQ